VASFAKSLGSLTAPVALFTPSFFYAALMLGRLVAPFLLRKIPEVRLVQAGLLFACLGMAGMIVSQKLAGVALSASAAGLGLSSVYPITIAILSRDFGGSSSKIASVMFVLSNIGGGLFPWIVGVASNGFGTLKAGLLVPLAGSAVMFLLYLQRLDAPAADRRDAADLQRI
jgi:fucose permease